MLQDFIITHKPHSMFSWNNYIRTDKQMHKHTFRGGRSKQALQMQHNYVTVQRPHSISFHQMIFLFWRSNGNLGAALSVNGKWVFVYILMPWAWNVLSVSVTSHSCSSSSRNLMVWHLTISVGPFVFLLHKHTNCIFLRLWRRSMVVSTSCP